MFCSNCGKELQIGDEFCTACGQAVASKVISQQINGLQQEVWWYRLLKVFYILLYIPLPLLILLVWSESSTTYDYTTKRSTDTSGAALWYSFITLIIYLTILRLVKVSTLYIIAAQKPKWRQEFKKLY